MKKSSIIWGTILIIIGVLILLCSYDIISFSWHHFWRLWPVVLILIGISVIPMKDWIKTTISILVIAGSLFLVVKPYDEQDHCSNWHIFTDLNFDEDDWDDIKSEIKKIGETSYVAQFDSTVTNVNLNIELTDCDSFSTKVNTNNNLVFETVGIAAYNLNTTTNETVADCSITPFKFDQDITKATLLFAPNLTYVLNLTSKSEYNNFNFSDVAISDLNLTASDDNNLWKITFGEQYSPVNVHLNTNDELENIELSIPASAGLSIYASDLSSQTEWNDLKKSDDKYVSDNYSTATVKIDITVDKISDIQFKINRI